MKGEWWHTALSVWIERCISSAQFPAVVFPHISHTHQHCTNQFRVQTVTRTGYGLIYLIMTKEANGATATAARSTCAPTACAHKQSFVSAPTWLPIQQPVWPSSFLNNNWSQNIWGTIFKHATLHSSGGNVMKNPLLNKKHIFKFCEFNSFIFLAMLSFLFHFKKLYMKSILIQLIN